MLVIKQWRKFKKFNYKQSVNPNIQLGALVIYPNDNNSIGVVIQLHDDGDFRTDMNGNTSMSEVRFATLTEVLLNRPKLIPYLSKSELIELCLIELKSDLECDFTTSIQVLLNSVAKNKLIAYIN